MQVSIATPGLVALCLTPIDAADINARRVSNMVQSYEPEGLES